MPTDTPDPNRYCPECERWRSPKPYCPECKCKTRDATEEELTGAEKPDGSLAFGRYVVEGGKAYEVRDLIDEGCWLKDGDVEIDASKVKRPLPSTPATYALLQAAWVEHFRVKVGTRVKIAREWSEKGDLSVIHPHYEMLNMVGSEQFVKEIDPGGVKLEDWWFPFHVLTVLPEVSQPAEQRVDFWAVTVSMNGKTLLTIDTDMSGKANLLEAEMSVIRKAGEHLLGFAGSGEPAPFFDPETGVSQPAEAREVNDECDEELATCMALLEENTAQLTALRTANAALAATVAGMREAATAARNALVEFEESWAEASWHPKNEQGPIMRPSRKVASDAIQQLNTALAAGKGESDEAP